MQQHGPAPANPEAAVDGLDGHDVDEPRVVVGIETAAHGVATRGALLDATALADGDWLEAGQAVYPEHLAIAIF